MLLLCLGVVIGKTLAWIGIAVALTVLSLFALATWHASGRTVAKATTPPPGPPRLPASVSAKAPAVNPAPVMTPAQRTPPAGVKSPLAEIRKAAAKRVGHESLLTTLRKELEAGRALLEPVSRPEYTLDGAEGWRLRSGKIEEDARSWARRVRKQLASDQQRLEVFDRGRDLPAPNPLQGLTMAAKREPLSGFLSDKVHNLAQIINTLEKEAP